MAKAAVSGGGSQSHGQRIEWQESLINELRGPPIPPDALTVMDIANKTGHPRQTVERRLRELVAAGKLARQRAGKSFVYFPPR